jgi:hypothetical protein
VFPLEKYIILEIDSQICFYLYMYPGEQQERSSIIDEEQSSKKINWDGVYVVYQEWKSVKLLHAIILLLQSD